MSGGRGIEYGLFERCVVMMDGWGIGERMRVIIFVWVSIEVMEEGRV